jgi:hypothetical protein
MPETSELRSVVDAAEQAAAAGDYASAEQLLREAADLQEVSLGPLHPDLANTLNNLGIVCEITDKPADAEQFFRRAYRIATAALDSDHPFVATSRKNLEDFCRARGKPFEPVLVAPPAAAAEPAPAKPPRRVDVPPARPAPLSARQAAPGPWSRPLTIGVLIGAALIVAVIAIPSFRSNDAVESPSVGASAPAPAIPSTTPAAAPVATSAKPPAAAARRANAAAVRGPVVVASADLCRNLSTEGSRGWRCVPPSVPADPGPLYFYTRLKSPADTTVQHRWYHDGRLHQVVELRVRANMIGGYRTYSRNTVNSQEAGDWRVELRMPDGTVLHERRFVVR